MGVNSIIQRSIGETIDFPFPMDIPNTTEQFLNDASLPKLFLKHRKRKCLMRILGQKKYLQQHIPESARKILWINLSAPSLGDTLMDLSSRTLLKNRHLDLFTANNNARLYHNDAIFHNVYTDKTKISENNYDFIIMDNFGASTLITKKSLAPNTPFTGMYGFYMASNTHRVLFSFHRLNHLLNNPIQPSQISAIAKPSITTTTDVKKTIDDLKLPACFLVIAVGGEWDFRTYPHWNQVISKIHRDHPQLKIVLVGSANGMMMRDKILALPDANQYITDTVNQYTFKETAEIIRRSELMVCADGGLFHATNCFAKPVITLLAKLPMKIYNTEALPITALYAPNHLNQIQPQQINQAINGVL
jgi:hypothetical protein